MPSSVVHVAFALVLAIGLLGAHYDRRAVFVVVAVVLVPEIDTIMGWVMVGAHRTVLHNAVFAVVAAVALAWETRRPESVIRDRIGDYGVRLAWVGLFAHAFAHLALDWAHLDGINVFWPLHDRFYRLEGVAFYSTSEGFVQTFVEIAEDAETGDRRFDAGAGGTRLETHVSNPAQPTRDPVTGPVDRRFPIAVQGWQLYLVCLGLFTVVARHFQTPRGTRMPDASDSRTPRESGTSPEAAEDDD